MKIFKDWNNKPIESFVVFLGKDVAAQKRRIKKLYKLYKDHGDIEAIKQYATQLGAAMQTNTLYEIAKHHFDLDSFKRKHINKKHEKN